MSVPTVTTLIGPKTLAIAQWSDHQRKAQYQGPSRRFHVILIPPVTQTVGQRESGVRNGFVVFRGARGPELFYPVVLDCHIEQLLRD
jgi:hypothetical protein